MAAFFVLCVIFIYKICTYMKKLIRLTEQDLHRIVKESVNRILKENANFDDYYFYRVDIHEPNSDNDIDSQCFNDEDEAYAYAKEQCFNQQLQADIYYFEDEWGDINSEADLGYADWNWIDCVGFVDGQMNQF